VKDTAMNELGKHIGKFVCYDREEEKGNRGFCWGLIKGVSEVNTMGGKRSVFILGRRICNCEGRVTRIDRDSILHIDSVNLEKNIVDFRGELDKISDNELFLDLMRGKQKKAFEFGMAEELGAGDWESAVKNELKKRMENEQSEN
jgi:hypothetical protein